MISSHTVPKHPHVKDIESHESTFSFRAFNPTFAEVLRIE